MNPSAEVVGTKPIKKVEYKAGEWAPHPFGLNASAVFWEKYDGNTQIFTVFSRDLMRAYLPACAGISEETYSVFERDIAFRRLIPIFIGPTARQLSWILAAAEGDIKKKRVLDLGCGSTGGTLDADPDDFGYTFHPWLCRTIQALGEHPVGVDIGNLDGKKFEAYGKTNLLLSDALGFIPDNSVDIVHSRALVTSPELQNQSLNLHDFSRKREYGEYLMDILNSQVRRVLKPSGVFVFCQGL